MEFKVGDKIQFKSWEEMEKEYGLNENGCIATIKYFTKEMRYLCGKTAEIEEISEFGVVKLKNFTPNGTIGWIYDVQMIKPLKTSKTKTKQSFHNDKVVIYYDEKGNRGVSKSAKGEKFDLEKGLAFAMLKTFGVSYTKFKEIYNNLKDEKDLRGDRRCTKHI